MRTTRTEHRRLIAAAITTTAFLLFSLLYAMAAAALPPIAAEFYGTVELDDMAAEPGTNITVHDSDGIMCGRHTTTAAGKFGPVSCKGDDPATKEDEGATNGDIVTIYANKIPAYNATWREGELNEARLQARTQRSLKLGSSGLPGTLIIPGIALILAAATYIYVRKGA